VYGCCGAWPPSQNLATARCARSAAPTAAAGFGSSAQSGAPAAPRLCVTRACCPAVRPCCSPAQQAAPDAVRCEAGRCEGSRRSSPIFPARCHPIGHVGGTGDCLCTATAMEPASYAGRIDARLPRG
jgi:hypothetical protein